MAAPALAETFLAFATLGSEPPAAESPISAAAVGAVAAVAAVVKAAKAVKIAAKAFFVAVKLFNSIFKRRTRDTAWPVLSSRAVHHRAIIALYK